MSTTDIYGFDKQGNAYHAGEVYNSWRGGMAVWRIMEERYLPPLKMFGIEISRLVAQSANKADEVWNLVERSDVSETDRIAMIATFDRCLVRKEDLPIVIKAFREFEGETSLPEQAEILEQMYGDDECIAVGFNQTSVNEPVWDKYDKDARMTIPYNCIKQNDHFWLSDMLKQVKEGAT